MNQSLYLGFKRVYFELKNANEKLRTKCCTLEEIKINKETEDILKEAIGRIEEKYKNQLSG